MTKEKKKAKIGHCIKCGQFINIELGGVCLDNCPCNKTRGIHGRFVHRAGSQMRSGRGMIDN